ncbi:MAG TPA: hypothetical protein VJT32_09205 [bacterium]|nr:hypothetical protein [bacterium]
MSADYAIAGRPTLTPATFRAALEHVHSPVTPLADEAYKICVAWGLNPAVALAFFLKESTGGTRGVAVATLDWGNLRFATWEGAVYKRADGWPQYASFLPSLNDWCALLKGPAYAGAGRTTVSKVCEVYAPPSENNTDLYIAQVNGMIATWAALELVGPVEHPPAHAPAQEVSPVAQSAPSPTPYSPHYAAVLRFVRTVVAQFGGQAVQLLLAKYGALHLGALGGITVAAAVQMVAKFLRDQNPWWNWLPV